MNSKLKRITIIVFTIEVIAAIGLFILIRSVARNHAKTDAFADMEMAARVKRASFETSMNEQLTLALQMVKMPAIKEYMLNPADEELKKQPLRTLRLLWNPSNQNQSSGFQIKIKFSGVICRPVML